MSKLSLLVALAVFGVLVGSPRSVDATTEIGLVIWMASEGGVPVQTEAWLESQLERANRELAPIDARVVVVERRDLDADPHIVTRDDRDALGRERWSPGVVHVFVVASLADVDQPGVIRGVHWRDREDRSHRWVILSSIAPTLTLVHELGHFFGLPHSDYEVSLMNKTPRALPAEERRFHEDELRRLERGIEGWVSPGG
jgi:hypothetical protein